MVQTDYRQVVLAEVVTALGTGPDVTMDQIEEKLGALYVQHQHANDQMGMTLINEAWGHISTIATAADKAINIAAAAKEVAVTMMGQRDAVIDAHGKLEKAIAQQDKKNPLVKKLIAQVEQETYEVVLEDGYHTGCPACDITENAMIDVTHDQAEIFFDCLVGQRIYDLPDELAEGLKLELKAFITQFVFKVYQAESGGENDEYDA